MGIVGGFVSWHSICVDRFRKTFGVVCVTGACKCFFTFGCLACFRFRTVSR